MEYQNSLTFYIYISISIYIYIFTSQFIDFFSINLTKNKTDMKHLASSIYKH